jgi:hypothetical protein
VTPCKAVTPAEASALFVAGICDFEGHALMTDRDVRAFGLRVVRFAPHRENHDGKNSKRLNGGHHDSEFGV